ncbi:hypothetical protein K461DRAFT_162341 [Myriangium duriaei CBS 260.36]|uniref:Nephrocystin 3-like N-terminal domain-containing protein n=1 Tax=Myriangium duriaei CBS 260.36 TaxID=1168546 RepID=A0A9P4IYA2_9PEZI|nr:hypothetical protein K461DRAFT_162341 [Myriangium duriaei CBS 260.36]
MALLKTIKERFRPSQGKKGDRQSSTGKSPVISSSPGTVNPNLVTSTAAPQLSQRLSPSGTANSARTPPNGSPGNANSIRAQSTVGQDATNASKSATHSGPSDEWSPAFRQAVNKAGESTRTLLQQDNFGELMRKLATRQDEALKDSVFLRGLRYLGDKAALHVFKLALDTADPLMSFDPTGTATTVSGILKGVTAMTISLASAGKEFASRIEKMLEEISYIEDCDALGERAVRKDIQAALVKVYEQLLVFYQSVYQILTKNGPILAIKMAWENGTLSETVVEFSAYTDKLQNVIQKATLDISEQTLSTVIDDQIGLALGRKEKDDIQGNHGKWRSLRTDEACEFLLADKRFIEWYQGAPSDRRLVVVGKLGSGKTMIMSFLVDYLKRRGRLSLPRPKICHHYCRAGMTGTATYIYSVLILQLLDQHPMLKKTFYEWYQDIRQAGDPPVTDTFQLQEFLAKAIASLNFPLYFLVDGLDECDDWSLTTLLKFFNGLLSSNIHLKIGLSSRKTPEVLNKLTGAAVVEVVSDSARDRLIVKQTVEVKLGDRDEGLKALVIDTLAPKAEGSGIWTRMIIEAINVRRCKTPGSTQRFLDEMPLPKDLSGLYKDLFDQLTSGDERNEELIRAALKILAISRRPLSMLELVWAINLTMIGQNVTTVKSLEEDEDPGQILSLIAPFIDSNTSSDKVNNVPGGTAQGNNDSQTWKTRQIRLVHQSAKEFVHEFVYKEEQIGPASTKHSISQAQYIEAKEHLEAWMTGICVNYLLLDEIGDIDGILTSDETIMDELRQDFGLFDDVISVEEVNPDDQKQTLVYYDPADRGFGELFVYAACYWRQHLGAIGAAQRPSSSSIERLCQTRSIRLKNWSLQELRPDCRVMTEYSVPDVSEDPLLIVSRSGSTRVLQDMLRNSNLDNRQYFNSNTVRHAFNDVVGRDDLPMISIFLADHRTRDVDFLLTIMRRYDVICLTRGPPQGWEGLFDRMLEITCQENWTHEILCRAARNGCMPMIQRLFSKAQGDAQLRDEMLSARYRTPGPRIQDHQSIGEAIAGGRDAVLEYLLQQDSIDAHLKYRNREGDNVLHLAADLCFEPVFRLLVPRCLDMLDERDGSGRTVLERIGRCSEPEERREECVKILLSAGSL